MTTLLDGVYEEKVDDVPEMAEALLAGAAPVKPPRSWFSDPSLNRVTPLTVTADGQIFGHIAPWDANHIGLPTATKPPRSRSDYAFFKTGVVETDDGNDVPVGQITLAGGHAALSADAGSAVKHYDDTASAFADVTVGDDAFGIWVNGALRPGVSEEQIRAIRASAPSGDWRPINGGLELVAICQVNVPGFPVARSMVAGGEIVSLVAAGASDMYRLRLEEAAKESVSMLANRLTRLEDKLEQKGIVARGNPIAGKDMVDHDVKEVGDDGKSHTANTDGPDAKDTAGENKAERLRAARKRMVSVRKKRLDARV